MKNITRRQFLSDSGKHAAIGGTVFSAMTSRHVLGANERVNIALIGCGGRGTSVTIGLASRADVELTYLCDLRDDRLETSAKRIAERVGGRAPKKVKNMQEVFDAKDVDAVIVGTPDHWHSPITIFACQAGKDVFVEKPPSHNIWEGRKMVESARKYKRVVQVGTQNRSAPYELAAAEYIRSGGLGDIHLVKVFNLKKGGPFHLGDPGQPPNDFNWDAWLGPAPKRPYHERLFLRGWHHFWDFSGGDLADDGIHQLDLAMMLMGDPGLPSAVSCSGGRFHHKSDESQVPDVQVVSYDFPNFVMTFELTQYPQYMSKTHGDIRHGDKFPYWLQNSTRIEIYGSKEQMIIGRHGGGWQAFTSGGKIVKQRYGRHPDPEHQQNFVESIKSRKRPNADIELGHRSAVMIHVANIAHRVGNQKLQFDGAKERFIDHQEANKLVKRHYRKGYQLPETV